MSEQNSINNKVIEIIANNLRVDPATINNDTKLREDLKVDSLGQVELAMELENAFDFKIAEDVAEKFQTVGDIVEYCENQNKKDHVS